MHIHNKFGQTIFNHKIRTVAVLALMGTSLSPLPAFVGDFGIAQATECVLDTDANGVSSAGDTIEGATAAGGSSNNTACGSLSDAS